MQPHGYNLAGLNYWSDHATIDLIPTGPDWTVKYGAPAATIGSDGWPIGPGTFKKMVPIAPVLTNYTVIVLDGQVDSVRLVGGPSAVVTAGVASFDAVLPNPSGMELDIKASSTGRTVVAMMRTEDVADWRAGKRIRAAVKDFVAGSPILRFLDWSGCNDNVVTAWTPANAPTFNSVVPLEYIAELCNDTGADCYVPLAYSLPDAERVRVITRLRAMLLPWIKVYLGPSNEIWNSKFDVNDLAMLDPGKVPGFTGAYAAKISHDIVTMPGVFVALEGWWISPADMQKTINAFKAANGIWDKVAVLAPAPYAAAPVTPYMPDNYAGFFAALEADRAKNAIHFTEWGALGKANSRPVWMYEINVQGNIKTGSREESAFVTKALQMPDMGPLMRRLFADADKAGFGTACVYVTIGTKFGTAADYSDKTGWPLRQVVLDRNRHAWPLQRAVPVAAPVVDLTGVRADAQALADKLRALAS